MRISKKYKLVFVSTPKSGSHTGWKIMDENFLIDEKAMHKNIVPGYAVDYTAFSFIRNPYDRAVSLWNSLLFAKNSSNTPREIQIAKKYRDIFLRAIGTDEFEAFTEFLISKEKNKLPNFYKIFVSSQTEYHSTSNLKRINFIKLEDNNVREFLRNYTGVDINYIPHELKRKHSTIEQVASERAINNIQIWAKVDFELFNYSI